MKGHFPLALLGCAVFALSFAVEPVLAQSFSVETGTSDVFAGPVPGDDILAPPPVPMPAPPFLVLPGGGFGLDVNAFSYGRTGPFGDNFFFSVDGAAAGAPGSATFFEITSGGPGNAQNDVFRTNIATTPGTNFQVHDGDGVGPGGIISPLGLLEPGSTFGGVDGYDTRSGMGLALGSLIYFSWNPVTGVAGGASPADILVAAAAPGFAVPVPPYATEAALGLVPFDIIDALEVYDVGASGVYDPGDMVLFSLDPTSPTLGLLGAGPGDILLASFGAPVLPFLSAAALGLAPGDNLNALSVSAIPVPPMVYAFGLAALALMRRRNKRDSS